MRADFFFLASFHRYSISCSHHNCVVIIFFHIRKPPCFSSPTLLHHPVHPRSLTKHLGRCDEDAGIVQKLSTNSKHLHLLATTHPLQQGLRRLTLNTSVTCGAALRHKFTWHVTFHEMLSVTHHHKSGLFFWVFIRLNAGNLAWFLRAVARLENRTLVSWMRFLWWQPHEKPLQRLPRMNEEAYTLHCAGRSAVLDTPQMNRKPLKSWRSLWLILGICKNQQWTWITNKGNKRVKRRLAEWLLHSYWRPRRFCFSNITDVLRTSERGGHNLMFLRLGTGKDC